MMPARPGRCVADELLTRRAPGPAAAPVFAAARQGCPACCGRAAAAGPACLVGSPDSVRAVCRRPGCWEAQRCSPAGMPRAHKLYQNAEPASARVLMPSAFPVQAKLLESLAAQH